MDAVVMALTCPITLNVWVSRWDAQGFFIVTDFPFPVIRIL